jgi:hypothetical protein
MQSSEVFGFKRQACSFAKYSTGVFTRMGETKVFARHALDLAVAGSEA